MRTNLYLAIVAFLLALQGVRAEAQLIGPGAKVTARLTNKTLFVDGTNGADNILVLVQYVDGVVGSVLDLQVNGKSIVIDKFSTQNALVTSVVANGYQGDDKIDCSTVHVATILNGGQGNDTLLGGPYVDNLSGDLGNDTLQGGQGDDFLYGQDGDDNIHGGKGDDKIYGSSGADTLYGDVGNDHIEPGDGSDSISLGDPTTSNGGNVYDMIIGFSKSLDHKLDPTNAGWNSVIMAK